MQSKDDNTSLNKTEADRCAGVPPLNAEKYLQSLDGPHLGDEQFHLLVDAVKDYAIFMLDTQGRVVSWNTGAERIQGYKAEEIIGKHFSVFYTSQDIQGGKPQHALDVAVAEGRFEDEGWRVRKDGSSFWANVVITPVRGRAGKILGFSSVIRDFTERNGAERELDLRNRVAKVLLTIADDEAYGEVLKIVLEATQGAYGVFGHFDEGGNLVAPSIAFSMSDKCQTPEKILVYSRESWSDIWGQTLREGKASWSNGPLPVPDGHVPVQRALSVPIMYQGSAIGVFTVANKAAAYDSEDLRLLESLADFVAPVLHARVERDIQEAKRWRAEENLRQAHSLLDSVLESTADGIIALDGAGRIQRFNREFAQMWRIPDSVAASKDDEQVWAFVTDQLRPPENFLARIREMPAQPEAESVDEVELKDGRVIERYSQPQKVDGTVTGTVWTFRDVTHRKRTEEALRLANDYNRRLIESTPVTLVATDLDGKIVDVNVATENITGRPRRELIGAYFCNYFTEPEKVRQAVQEGSVSDSAFEIQHGDGRVISVLCSAVLARDEFGKPFRVVVAVRDITEIKRAQEALRSRAEELARSNAELQQFAYVASHDLQEPLRMVRSFTELLARRYQGKLGTEADEFIRFAVEGATRMQQLIDGLLTLSRVETRGHPLKPVDSEAVMQSTLTCLTPAILESGATVTHDPLPVARADEVQLGQLLQNLLGNALKFRGEEPPRIHVSARQEKREWVFSVRDNGIGIEPRHLERIFLVFQRLHTRDEYPGTGIGLAVCKRIVERYHGRIWVESQPGEGATFYFTIPA